MNSDSVSAAERLDRKVASLYPGLSRASASKLIAQGRVRVNNVVTTKAGHRIRPADRLHVDYDVKRSGQIAELKLPVLYEDEDCVVINKPPGVLTHSKGAFNPEPTVATWLKSRVPNLDGERAGIVHRLDRVTSGVMICAKTPAALHWLQRQFAERQVVKTYAALVSGKVDPPAAIIDMPIERNPKRPATFRVGVNGKPAVTTYRTIHQTANTTLLELVPKTGRTHQLRVHLAYRGHPIIGDALYGGIPADRLYLHAKELELTLPNGKRRTFTEPIPPTFRTEALSR